MPSNFPGGLDTFTTKVDQVNTILAADVNKLQDAVTALEIGGVSSQTIAYAGTITPDTAAGQFVKVGTLTGNITVNNPLNAALGKELIFQFTQDATGGRTVTWGAAFKTAWQVPPAPNATDTISFVYDGTNWQDLTAISVDQFGNANFPPVFNVKFFGAKGDGVTDDTAAQLAFASAIAGTGTGTGKKGFYPAGTYLSTQQITFTDCVVEGAGRDHSVIKTTTALGTGVPLVILTKGSGLRRAAMMSGVSVTGPSSCPLGGPRSANCDGIKITDTAVLRDVRVSSFDSGVVLVGDHITLQNVEAEFNYYGVYDTGGIGDHFIIDCNINNNLFANIAVPGNKTLFDTVIERTHLGFAPYGIYHETDASPISFMTDCILNKAHFEAIGNVAIFDENFASGALPTFNGNTIITPNHTFNNTYKITARVQDYAIKVAYSNYANLVMLGQGGFASGTGGQIYFGTLNAAIYIFGGNVGDVVTTNAGTATFVQKWSRFGELRPNVLEAYQQIYGGSGVTANTIQTAAGILGGTGAPNNAVGNNGDIYIRSDGGGGNPTLYQRRAGIWVEFYQSLQSPVFAASYTPNPLLGSFISIGALTANVTVNNVATPLTGQNITLVFTQDGTGGRTITWGAAYKVNWVPSLAPSAKNSITFIYDGTNWIQTSVATSL